MQKLIGLLVVIVLIGVAYFEFQEPVIEDVPNAEAEASVLEEPARENEEPVVADESYTLQVESSTMAWEAGKIVGEPYTGKVALKSGSLELKDGAYVGGSFVIDMTDMTHDDDKEAVINHLQNEDFFDVVQYPTSRFEITSISQKSDDSYEVTGELTILDNTHALTFESEILESDTSVTATASFTIDRTTWGINFRSGSFFTDLGDKAIKDEIGFELDLTFMKS